jgi:hypothetical protein
MKIKLQNFAKQAWELKNLSWKDRKSETVQSICNLPGRSKSSALPVQSCLRPRGKGETACGQKLFGGCYKLSTMKKLLLRMP